MLYPELGVGNEAALVHYASRRRGGSVAAISTYAAGGPDAADRRAYVFGGKRSRGRGSAFRVHARAFGVRLDERLQFADGGSLGRRRRQPDPDIRERAGGYAARSDSLARNTGYRST